MLINPILHNKTKVRCNVTDEEIYNLADQTWQIPDEFSYSVVETTDAFIARMDLVSKRMYGTPIYSDLLCKLNGISNPFELNSHQVLIVPDINELPKFFFKDTNTEEDAKDANGRQHSNLKKHDTKRSPNEAVIGDKRFRIDTTKKIIIY